MAKHDAAAGEEDGNGCWYERLLFVEPPTVCRPAGAAVVAVHQDAAAVGAEGGRERRGEGYFAVGILSPVVAPAAAPTAAVVAAAAAASVAVVVVAATVTAGGGAMEWAAI